MRTDAYSQFRLAWDRVRQLGYRRIGAALCRHPVEIPDDEIRRAACLLCQSRDVSQADLIPPYLGAFEDRGAYDEWVQIHRPDAIIGFGMSHYCGILKSGFRCSEEVAYCSPACDRTCPLQREHGISGIEEDWDALSQATIALLEQLIPRGQFGIPIPRRDIVISGIWRPGRSLTPAASRTLPTVTPLCSA